MRKVDSSRFDDRPFDTRLLFGSNSHQLLLWNFSNSSQEPAAEIIGLTDDLDDFSLYAPTQGEALYLHSQAWDMTGQPRIALWWKAMDDITNSSGIIEIRNSLNGLVLWQIQGDALEPKICTPSQGDHEVQLHLYGDTVRLLDSFGLYQIHRSGYQTFQAYDDTRNLRLRSLSGEVCDIKNIPSSAFGSADGRFFFDPFDGCVYDMEAESPPETLLPNIYVPALRRQGLWPHYGLWLPERQRYVQDLEGQPLMYMTPQHVVNDLMAEGLLVEPIEVRPLPVTPPDQQAAGIVPKWLLGDQMPKPPICSERGALLTDLSALRSALIERGWVIEAGLCLRTAVDLPTATVVAEVLQRPEGTCVMMTAWRGLWPVRWGSLAQHLCNRKRGVANRRSAGAGTRPPAPDST
ncbi:hypothetical protein EHF33_20040 (plasmid) [Deinococcus psychrotolerans]|uniref:Uncharacterized protein n=1 Tax=Deinococcus psychrotolerans TaxID=2489213 RepID=A0A3G8YVI3_9DEIO|nr:hypothetical protein [Deinococcus psychrotolerans]AZI45206.1 hypothetical protein EHF33_20040 [Deinococcus psychrotolerans]